MHIIVEHDVSTVMNDAVFPTDVRGGALVGVINGLRSAKVLCVEPCVWSVMSWGDTYAKLNEIAIPRPSV